MATPARMDDSSAERTPWYERTISGPVLIRPEPESGSEFDYELSSAENKNTKRKTETDMRIFSSFLLTLNEPRAAEAVEPVELNRYLTTFFSVIKKHDGNEYEPASLRGMLCSIERYLRSRSYPKSLTRDVVFLSTRNTLKDRQLVLRELAKSAKKGKQEVLTSSSIEKLKQLYSAKEFGPYSPMAVINSLCFAFVVHLKIRKAIDHKQLLWGDIALKTQDSREYLCYDPVQGRDYFRQRLGNISHYRIYSQSEPGSPTDPVAVYKLYASKRPSQVMSPDSPFYLGLAVNQTLDQQPQWFKASPMGVNKLNDLVRMIREITGNLTVTVSSSVNNAMDRSSIGAAIAADGSYSSDNAAAILQSTNDNSERVVTEFRSEECALTEFRSEKCALPEFRSGEIALTDFRPGTSIPAATQGVNEAVKVAQGDRDDITDDEHETCFDTVSDTGDRANANDRNTSNTASKIQQCATEPKTRTPDNLSDTGKTSQSTEPQGRQSQAKQAITHILNSLEPPDKQAVLKWVAESYEHAGLPCQNCATPRQFSINFTMGGTDAMVNAVVKSSPVEEERKAPGLHNGVKSAAISRASSPCSSDVQAHLLSNVDDLQQDDDSSSDADDENSSHLPDQLDRRVTSDSPSFLGRITADSPSSTSFQHSTQTNKRAASDDGARELKIPRTHDHSNEATSPTSITGNNSDIDIETDSNCHNNVFSGSNEKETGVSASNEAAELQNDARTDAMNVKPWFAAWPFDPRLIDPRLTMYLRQGLMPMYGDCAAGYMGNVNTGDS